MSRMLFHFTAMISIAVVLSVPSARAQVKTGTEQFPLAKGSYWIYEGMEERQEAGQGPKVFTEKITRRMEVVDRIERNRLVAAVVRGGILLRAQMVGVEVVSIAKNALGLGQRALRVQHR